MAHLPAPPYLNVSERLKKMASPKVDIIVGSEKKHYLVPVDILCHYSQCFDLCLHGDFEEAVEQRIDLSEDDVDLFEVLLEYIITGRTPISLVPREPESADLENYFKFLRYADEYSVPLAGMDVYDNLVNILSSRKVELEEEHIRAVISLFPENHAVHGLFARAFLNAASNGLWSGNDGLEQDVDGLASEMIQQLRDFVFPKKPGIPRT